MRSRSDGLRFAKPYYGVRDGAVHLDGGHANSGEACGAVLEFLAYWMLALEASRMSEPRRLLSNLIV